MDEFALIETFFQALPSRDDVLLGIGDDAACIQVERDKTLLVSTDTLVSGVHFLPNWDAYDIACKAVLVNISDMVAMAAPPCWATLALTLPELDEQWLLRFAQGLRDTLGHYGIALVGGDTTRGPLTITITIMGQASPHHIVKRSGAGPGDRIFVSDPLGAAALAVQLLEETDVAEKDRAVLMQALLHPSPRMDLLPLLSQFASAAIDISDGLSSDLNHICLSSGVGACLNEEAIPIHPLLPSYAKTEALPLALHGGDDYALCFTVPHQQQEAFQVALKTANLVCYPVGFIEEKPGLRIQTGAGESKPLPIEGYLHF